MGAIFFNRTDDGPLMLYEIECDICRHSAHCYKFNVDDYVLLMGRGVYDKLNRPTRVCGVRVRIMPSRSCEFVVELVARNNMSLINDYREYIEHDIIAVKEYLNRLYGTGIKEETNMNKINYQRKHALTRIKKVIFNDPATIVFWNDGTKTVVKADDEPFDPEKGLAMAISKYFFDNEGWYYDIFKKWLPEESNKKGAK